MAQALDLGFKIHGNLRQLATVLLDSAALAAQFEANGAEGSFAAQKREASAHRRQPRGGEWPAMTHARRLTNQAGGSSAHK